MRARGSRWGNLRLPAVGLAAVALVLVAAACGAEGVSKGGDTARGKQLFVSSCGGCHTLADAGTKGTTGPNLDDAFAADRRQGFAQSSIQQVVAAQIRFPLEPISTPAKQDVNPVGGPVMPANLVKGEDVNDVAAYVASVAGKAVSGGGGGGKITATNGKQIFLTAGCTGCHTLADVGSHGTVGPNLDQAKPPTSLVVTRVTNGAGAMPSFKDRLTRQQIQAVAQYVSSVAGK